MRRSLTLTVVALALLAPAGPASAADPFALDQQLNNILFATSRGNDLTPSLLAQVGATAARRSAARLALLGKDPERSPDPNFCTLQVCVGDPRVYGWANGKGMVEPVLFTARDGATLSGHVWATKRGPAKRPGIVIVNGSIVGFEEAYWGTAQALAKSGYVVLTFDTQGEGNSDQFGEAPDQAESLIAGTPPIGDGGPFYDGGTDALDFLLSTAAKPYKPRPSRTSGTSHAPKQARRVAKGLNSAYNPLAGMLDPARIGIAGHSYGAMAASYLGQSDKRIGAVVAYDSLCYPHNSTRSEIAALATPDPTGAGGLPLPNAFNSFSRDCFGAPPGYKPDVAPRAPALGLTNDYILAPLPFTARPNRDYKARVAEDYAKAGVDSGNIVVRGGTHLEWSWVPLPHGTLRGIDLGTWYTVAWFDKYLKHDPTADARLLSGRWRSDARGRAVDPSHDANLFSDFFRSPIDIHVGGKRVACADLRKGCPNLVPAADDCGPAIYGYLPVGTKPDDGTNPNLAACSAGTTLSATGAKKWSRAYGRTARRIPVVVRTAGGRSVSGVHVALQRKKGRRWVTLARAATRPVLTPGHGRTLRLTPKRKLPKGTYRLIVAGRTTAQAPQAVRTVRTITVKR